MQEYGGHIVVSVYMWFFTSHGSIIHLLNGMFMIYMYCTQPVCHLTMKLYSLK